ncbi:MAG: hypothetical protein M3Q69_08430 [Acidobacteriota bacterium]|nr:hypothetical protein [Acidobacteriota bacterium]
MIAEAQQTSNPIRLIVLSREIRSELDAAIADNPDDVEVRLDLVRWFVMTPVIGGGDLSAARAQAAEIGKRDVAMGHFARGYIAYRQKEYGAGRVELREAMRTAKSAATRDLAAKWLGWLSQESQQWDDAFAIFEALRANDRSALYEIWRTSQFCRCRRAEGEAALREYKNR